MNDTNETTNHSCQIEHTLDTFFDFLTCYSYHFRTKPAAGIFEILLTISVFSANLTVIIRIQRKRECKQIYDKILTWLTGSYLLTSLIGFPFFHIQSLFGYWPFGEASSVIWTIYDNNTATFVSLLMLYMTFARFRSIHAPMNYLREKIFRFPHLVILLFWISGIVCWTITVVIFRTFPYETHIIYKPHIFQFIINFFIWFLPLLGVYIFAGIILYRLHHIQARKKQMNVSTMISLSVLGEIFNPKSKFMVIIAAFLVQWTVPCVFMLVETFAVIELEEVILAFKWSTYTVCLTDPMLILIFII